MLQQTRVDTVVPYYERFLRRFPDLEHLADADPEEVRSLWSGLGYYRRAQLMLRAATLIRERHGGRLPDQVDALAALPGFGPYTVGAVASLAFGLPVPAVDGNVERVMTRWLGLTEDPRTVRRCIRAEAEAWVDAPDPGKTNEALMELGATVCTPRNPSCLTCPLRPDCTAQAKGLQDRIPPPRARRPPRRVDLTAWVVLNREGVWMVQSPPDGLFPELWCVPLEPGHGPEPPLATVEHVLTHRRLVVQVRRADRWAGPGRAIPPSRLFEVALPTVVRKVLKAALSPTEWAAVRWASDGVAEPRPEGIHQT
jgi:A/G-specific adenine glycosylase